MNNKTSIFIVNSKAKGNLWQIFHDRCFKWLLHKNILWYPLPNDKQHCCLMELATFSSSTLCTDTCTCITLNCHKLSLWNKVFLRESKYISQIQAPDARFFQYGDSGNNEMYCLFLEIDWNYLNSHFSILLIPTVQTLNSCTSHPDVCHCLVVQTPMDNISRYQWTTLLANQSYVQSWGHSCIHAQETKWQSVVRSCIMPGLPIHLMQELNVVTSWCSSIACKDRLCLSFSTQVVHHYYMMRHVQTSHGKG